MIQYRLLFFGATLAVVSLVWNGFVTRRIIQRKLDDNYNYIIVGAGSAGCVLANRLSADPDVRVLLLEAGDSDAKFSSISIPLHRSQLTHTEVDWNYTTLPQQHACHSMIDKKCGMFTSRVLGGSSSTGDMLYLRASRRDFDWNWQLKGWSYEDVLPYFIKSENNQNQQFLQSGYHGNAGELVVSDIRVTSLPEAFTLAGREMGYPTVDVNDGQNIEGFMHTQALISRGRRWSNVDAYLQPAMIRKNLHVATLAHVTKIIFEGKRAVGVEFVYNETHQEVRASKEIIVTAGTIGSAKLLLLSGIGPAKQLTDLKIPLVADLPVGENLQDHVTVDAPAFFLREPIAIRDDKVASFWVYIDYLLFGTGYYSSADGIDGIAHLILTHDDEKKLSLVRLSLLNHLYGNSMQRLQTYRALSNIDEEVLTKLHSGCDDKDGVILLSTLLHPKSSGRVYLENADYLSPPIIDPNYLSEPEDVEMLIEGIRFAAKLSVTKMFDSLGFESLNRVHSGCTEYIYDSNDYWRCYIRHTATPASIPVGTCKMGEINNPTAVVDLHLRVKGIQGLRVIDSSVIPFITSGTDVVMETMIAEKAADIILGQFTADKINISSKLHDTQQ